MKKTLLTLSLLTLAGPLDSLASSGVSTTDPLELTHEFEDTERPSWDYMPTSTIDELTTIERLIIVDTLVDAGSELRIANQEIKTQCEDATLFQFGTNAQADQLLRTRLVTEAMAMLDSSDGQVNVPAKWSMSVPATFDREQGTVFAQGVYIPSTHFDQDCQNTIDQSLDQAGDKIFGYTPDGMESCALVNNIISFGKGDNTAVVIMPSLNCPFTLPELLPNSVDITSPHHD